MHRVWLAGLSITTHGKATNHTVSLVQRQQLVRIAWYMSYIVLMGTHMDFLACTRGQLPCPQCSIRNDGPPGDVEAGFDEAEQSATWYVFRDQEEQDRSWGLQPLSPHIVHLCNPSPTTHRDTRAVMLRVLTARAVQRTMMQLQQHHVIAANWLNHYCIENPPLGGDEFLLKLYSQPALRVYDEIRRGWVIINPQDISSTVLEHRHRLSQFLVQVGDVVLRGAHDAVTGGRLLSSCALSP